MTRVNAEILSDNVPDVMMVFKNLPEDDDVPSAEAYCAFSC